MTGGPDGGMKRKREVKPQLSAFAARRLAAAEEEVAEARRVLLAPSTPDDGRSEEGQLDSEELSTAGSEAEDPSSNPYAALGSLPGSRGAVHGSRADRVAAAEAVAAFAPRIHKCADGSVLLGLAADEVIKKGRISDERLIQ